MNKIRLVLKGVSEIVGDDNLGLLILTDVAQTRQLSIICDKQMEYQFGLRMSKAPVANIMLPEVMAQVISRQTTLNIEMQIYDIVDGQYQASLVNNDTLQTVPIRASDAILFSFVSHCPLYIEERLMMRQSVPYSTNSPGMVIPVNSISNSMLQSALKKAIQEENYELASHLHEEMQRRKKRGAVFNEESQKS